MDSITFDLLANKLKNAPQSALERVIAYVDTFIEPTTISKNYTLTKEQQQILDNQINSDKTRWRRFVVIVSAGIYLCPQR